MRCYILTVFIAFISVHVTDVSSNSIPTSFNFRQNIVTYDNCTQLTSSTTTPFILCYSLRTNNNLIDLALRYASIGWLALGFTPNNEGNAMLGSIAAVGWSDGTTNNTFAAAFQLTTFNPEVFMQQTSTMLQSRDVDIDYDTPSAMTTLIMTRPLTLTSGGPGWANIDASAPTLIVCAAGPLPPSSTSVISKHNVTSTNSIVFATGVVTDVTASTVWRTAHITLMSLAFGLILPAAIFSSRFFKFYRFHSRVWFDTHWLLATTALVMVLAGFIIGVNKIGYGDVGGVYSAHRNIGIAVLTFLLIQYIIALIRPGPPTVMQDDMTTARYVWQIIHHWNGRLVYLLAIANVFVGFNIINDRSMLILFAVLWSIIIAVGIYWQINLSLTGKPPLVEWIGSPDDAKQKAIDVAIVTGMSPGAGLTPLSFTTATNNAHTSNAQVQVTSMITPSPLSPSSSSVDYANLASPTSSAVVPSPMPPPLPLSPPNMSPTSTMTEGVLLHGRTSSVSSIARI